MRWCQFLTPPFGISVGGIETDYRLEIIIILFNAKNSRRVLTLTLPHYFRRSFFLLWKLS